MKMRPLTLVASLFWMILVLLVYYWIHKPLTTLFSQAVGGALLDLISALVFIIISAGIGRSVIHHFFPIWRNFSRPEQLAGEALLGLGILANLILFVGVFMLHIISITLLLILLTGLTYRTIFEWLREFGRLIRQIRQLQRWNRVLGIFVAFNLTLALIMAFAPPTKFDSLTYHLLGPKHWLNNGSIGKLSGSHFFGFPQLINTLYAGQMVLTFGQLTSAAVLHWMMGGLSLLVVGGYGARRFSVHVGLLAVAILLSATSIWLQFGYPYVDLPPVGFAFIAYLSLEQWRQEGKSNWLILTGVFIGLMMSVKYPLVGAGVVAGLYILVFSPRNRLLPNLALMVIVASVVLSPWLIRNWVFYDNPIYPYGPATAEWDDLYAEWYASPSDSLLNTTAWMWFTYPLTSTFLGFEGAGGYGSTIGPLFLLLLPMLFVTWRGIDDTQRHHLKNMGVYVIGFVIVWLFMAAISVYGAQTRLWFAMFPMLALMAAVALESLKLLPKKPLDFRFVMSAMVVLVLILAAVDHVRGTRSERDKIEGTTLESHFLQKGALNYLLGVVSKNRYLEDNLGAHIVAIWEVNKLPDDSKVLFLWETRSLYCEEPRLTCLEDSILARWWHDRRTIGSSAEILNSWREDGVTHILVYETGRKFEFDNSPRFTEGDKSAWEQIPSLLELVWDGDGKYTLYVLR